MEVVAQISKENKAEKIRGRISNSQNTERILTKF